jgi:hypothetical protein
MRKPYLQKLAWPYNVGEVYQKTPEPSVRGDLLRGRWLGQQLKPARQTRKDAFTGAKAIGNAALSPATKVGPSILRGLGAVGSFRQKNPRLLRLGAGAMLAAPILGKAFSNTQHTLEDAQMSSYRNPERVITASLDKFLEKHAQNQRQGIARGMTAGRGSGRLFDSGEAAKALSTGIGSGIGSKAVDGLFGALGGLAGMLKDKIFTDPRRKAILDTIMRNDQIIRDTIAHNPNGKQMIAEAYQTMVTVAPTLSTDINAVRSFLREAVIGGAGVNYATIKNLAEAERAVAGNRYSGGGK